MDSPAGDERQLVKPKGSPETHDKVPTSQAAAAAAAAATRPCEDNVLSSVPGSEPRSRTDRMHLSCITSSHFEVCSSFVQWPDGEEFEGVVRTHTIQQQQQQQPSPPTKEPQHSSLSPSENQNPLPQRNRGFPDIDDDAMNDVLSYTAAYQQDLQWSFASDLFFVMGGLSYVALDLAACFEGYVAFYYTYLNVLGPAVYLINSIIDTLWALQVVRRHRLKHQMAKTWEELPHSTVATTTVPTLQSSQDDFCSTTTGLFRRLRRHAAHRRTVWAACSFGLAAFLALVAAAHPDRASTPLCDFLSAHIYILSALIAITGERTRPWLGVNSTSAYSVGPSSGLFENPEILEDMGDLLFLIGSIVDAFLIDLAWEEPWLLLFSDMLWLFDAFLYVKSDFILWANSRHPKTMPEGNTLV